LDDFAFALALVDGLAVFFVGLAVFETDLELFWLPVDFLGALLEPAARALLFEAAGAFANWSSRRTAFPGITKTHVKSEKSV